MINNEMETVTVVRYSEEVDDYGQFRQLTDESFDIQMFIRRHKDEYVADPRFNGIEYTGLTNYRGLKYEDEIIYQEKKLIVISIIESKRYVTVIMKLQ